MSEYKSLPKIKRRENASMGATWWAEWYESAREPGGGERRVHRSLSLGLCSKLPLKSARKLLAERMPSQAIPVGWTFRRFTAEVWLRPRIERWAPSSASSIVAMIDKYIMPIFSEREMGSIRKMDVEAAVSRWAKQGLSKATGKLLLGQLRSILEEAVDNEIINRNPARGVRLPAKMPGRVTTQPYTIPEVRNMLALVRGTDGIMLRLLLYCGLRPGELLALRVGDLRDGFLVVDESTDSAESVKDTKTHKVRLVPVPPGLLRDLRAYLVVRPDNPLELMFPGSRCTYWTVWGFNEHLQTILDKAVKDFSLRRFRATCATLLDAEVSDVRDILGHTDEDMTLAHYRRGLPERQAAAVAELERGISRGKIPNREQMKKASQWNQ